MTEEKANKAEQWRTEAARDRELLETCSKEALAHTVIEQRTELRRLRKRLARTQERAARLEQEAGSRFLKSWGAQWFRIACERANENTALQKEIRDLKTQLQSEKNAANRSTLAQVAELIKKAGLL